MPHPRKDIIAWLPEQYYHIYNRGARHGSIFREPTNYLFVIARTKQYAKALSVSVIAYCLMPNHYHFLVRQNGDTAAGLLPKRVFNSYTKAYNKRYEQSGTLFEHRYQVRAILNFTHLLHLCRYIHANPARDGLVADPADWPYSNISNGSASELARSWIGNLSKIGLGMGLITNPSCLIICAAAPYQKMCSDI
jgi:REP element-mobilizing transposase RayT